MTVEHRKSIQASIINLLAEFREEMRLSYLFIAHNLALVEHVSDDVAVMYGGKIVEQGSAVDIYQHPQHSYTKALLAAVPTLG